LTDEPQTIYYPFFKIDLAIAKQDVVPSPDSSLLIYDASLNSKAPMFYKGLPSILILLATVIPSFVIIG
jgi:hypothetical protein